MGPKGIMAGAGSGGREGRIPEVEGRWKIMKDFANFA